jgi:RimJ/RimL family protein N-acetyltransferase
MHTSRTTLTLATIDDFEELLAMYTEPDTFKYIKHLQNLSREEYLGFLHSRLDLRQKKQGYYWVARHKTTNELIGAMNLTPFMDTGIMQLGFQIRRQFWKLGYGSELAEAILRFAIDEVGLEEVYGFFEKENTASGKILEKLGFQFKERKRFKEDGAALEVYVYSV